MLRLYRVSWLSQDTPEGGESWIDVKAGNPWQALHKVELYLKSLDDEETDADQDDYPIYISAWIKSIKVEEIA